MKDIRCFFGFHKFSNWKYISKNEFNQNKLERICKKCNKLEIYEGLVNECIETGEKTPYIFTDF